MATTNVSLAKSAGWVVVSSATNIFVSNPNSQALEYCWSDTPPDPLFRPHTLHANHGVARDFETGALRMRNTGHAEEVIIALDEA
jgi:hypothetical protein